MKYFVFLVFLLLVIKVSCWTVDLLSTGVNNNSTSIIDEKIEKIIGVNNKIGDKK